MITVSSTGRCSGSRAARVCRRFLPDGRILHRQFQIHLPGHGSGRLFALLSKHVPDEHFELPLRLRELLFKPGDFVLLGGFQFAHTASYPSKRAGPGKCESVRKNDAAVLS
jgi:hypothetical protein